MKINYNKKHKSGGLSLFELVFTITISSIIFTISLMFVNSAVNMTQQVSSIKQCNNSPKVVLNILTEYFMNNNGNVNITKDNNLNTLTLSFNIPDPYNENLNIQVAYTYDSTYHQLYKKLPNENSQLLLNNIDNCNFTTAISSNMTNITLTINMLIKQPNATFTVYEVINAPYTNQIT